MMAQRHKTNDGTEAQDEDGTEAQGEEAQRQKGMEAKRHGGTKKALRQTMMKNNGWHPSVRQRI